MDIENAVNVQAANAAPVIVDPQVTNKDDPGRKEVERAEANDSVEISSEASSAKAVQEAPAVESQANPENDAESPLSAKEAPEENEVSVENEAPEVNNDGIATGNANQLTQEIANLRESSQESFDSRRTTKYTVTDGNIQVSIKNGDKEVDIPPEEVINTKRNLSQRLQAFIDASNLDINA
jgi:hypothetical protein